MAAPSGFLSEVVGKVTFVNKWPMLLKATQDDDTPTPGYLYKEIANLTYVSGSNCQCLTDFLVDRLDKNSCHVKFKVLRVMLHVVENGHKEFQVGLRRQAQGIQQATKYSGPPHPLHGMAPYVAVRKAARELSEILFDTERPVQSLCSRHSAKAGHMTCQSGSFTASGKKMEGFGNTPKTEEKPVTIESVSESVREGLQQIANKLSVDNLSSLTFTQSGSSTGYKQLHGTDPSFSDTDRGSFGRLPVQPSRPVRSGNYTAVMMVDEDEPTDNGHSNKGVRASSSAKDIAAGEKLDMFMTDSRGRNSNDSKSSGQLSDGSTDLSERLASVAVADWSQEMTVVDDFALNSQTKPTPTKEELLQFVKRSSSLNCEKIIELLTSSLKSSSQNIRLRCLFGIEGILKDDLISSDVALSLVGSHLASLHSSVDKSVRAKAAKILQQLEKLEADAHLDQPLIIREPSETNSLILTPAITSFHNVRHTIADTAVGRHPFCDLPDKTTRQSSSSGSLFSGMNLVSKPSTNGNPEMASPNHGSTGSFQDSDRTEQRQLQDDDDMLLDFHMKGAVDVNNKFSLQSNPEHSHMILIDSQHKQVKSQTNLMNFTTPEQLQGQNLKLKSAGQPTNGALNSTRTHIELDPIMSRAAGFADLWSSMVPDNPSTSNSSVQSRTGNETEIRMATRAGNQHPGLYLQTGMNAQQISQLYPQLSAAKLSGMSPTPLNLSQKPATGFGFVVTNDNQNQQKQLPSSDAFSFVQEAMKINKK